MANAFRLKRGTAAQIAASAASNGLANGEPYLITDEQRIAIGLGPNTFERFAKLSEVGGGGGGIDVTTAMQILPDNIPVAEWQPNIYVPAGSSRGPIGIFSAGTTDPVQFATGVTNTARGAWPFGRFTSLSSTYDISGLRTGEALVKKGTTTFGGFFYEAVVGRNSFVNGQNGQYGVMDSAFEYSSFAAGLQGIWFGWDVGDTTASKLRLYTGDGTNLTSVVSAASPTIGVDPIWYFRIVMLPGDTKAYVTALDLRTNTYLWENAEITATLPQAQIPLYAVCGSSTVATTTPAVTDIYWVSLVPYYDFNIRGTSVTSQAPTGGLSTAVTANLDFGSVPVYSKSFQVADVTALTGDKFLAGAAPDSDEYEMDGLICSAYCNVAGTVVIFVQAQPGPLTGIRKVTYTKA